MKRRGPKLTLGSYYYCCCCSSSSHVVIEKKFVCFFGVSFLSFSLLLLLVGWWMMKKKRKMFVRLMNDEKNLAGTIVLDIVGGVSPSCKCRSTGVIGYLVWCSSLLLCFACLLVCLLSIDNLCLLELSSDVWLRAWFWRIISSAWLRVHQWSAKSLLSRVSRVRTQQQQTYSKQQQTQQTQMQTSTLATHAASTNNTSTMSQLPNSNTPLIKKKQLTD